MDPNISQTPASHKSLLEGFNYLQDFSLEIQKAKVKITVANMTLDPDQMGETLLKVFNLAPNGINKEIFLEYFAILTHGVFHSHYKFNPFIKRSVRDYLSKKSDFYKQIKSSGINLKLTSETHNLWHMITDKIFPDHIRGARVDNNVFYFGQANIDSVTNHDFMIKFIGKIAEKLAIEFDDIHSNKTVNNKVVKLDEVTDLYIDCGSSADSLIVKKAQDEIKTIQKNLKSIHTMLPDRSVIDDFSQTNRFGLIVESLIFIPPIETTLLLDWNKYDQIETSLTRIMKTVKSQEENIWRNPFRDTHSKMLIIDDKKVLFGTHNLNSKETRKNIKRWAIFTEDPDLVSKMVKKFNEYKSHSVQSLPNIS